MDILEKYNFSYVFGKWTEFYIVAHIERSDTNNFYEYHFYQHKGNFSIRIWSFFIWKSFQPESMPTARIRISLHLKHCHFESNTVAPLSVTFLRIEVISRKIYSSTEKQSLPNEVWSDDTRSLKKTSSRLDHNTVVRIWWSLGRCEYERFMDKE